jgi:glycyl-tRNA synthetase
MSIGEAVEKGIVNNETLAYFIIRTYHFLLRVGCKAEGVRFRQHLLDEKAHYSSDCWDAEVITSYGWVEVVGIADRSAYDLTKHAEHSKKELVAAIKLKSPKLVKFLEATTNKQLLGKTFKTNNKTVLEWIESLSDEDKAPIQAAFEKKENYIATIGGAEFTLTPEMISFKNVEKNVVEEKYVPNVIEPAFGIGRIIYAAWEHNFMMRNKERTYISLPPKVAPYKCSILTLMQDEKLEPFVHEISNLRCL